MRTPGLNRSTYYLPPAVASAEDLRLMRLIDEQYPQDAVLRQPADDGHLGASRETVNRKRVQRLMRLMGMEALLSEAADDDPGDAARRLYPVPAPRPGVDPGRRGLEFGYHLCADEARVHVPDGGDRLVQPLRAVVAAVEHAGGGFCLEALDEALSTGRPEIFNTDQGSQFMSREYTGRLEEAGIAVSRDGRGRCAGQRVRGAALEEREIRGHLHQRL